MKGSAGEPPSVLGVILAGGQNRRYDGRPKALETVGGTRIAGRAINAMREATNRVVLVANDAETFRELGLPMRPDLKAGHGSLGGILTAVDWAREEGCRGALVAACDMPFLSAGLLKQLAQDAEQTDVVAPASDSRRGLEPLCAFYGVATLPAIQAALERGDRQIVSFFPDVQLHVLPREEVAEFGEPDTLFLNVNTPEDREHAEQIVHRVKLSKS